MPKKEEIKEDKDDDKVIVVPRAVSNADMFNAISDKLDAIFTRLGALEKLAKE